MDKREIAIQLLIKKSQELNRIPKKSDFDSEDLVYIAKINTAHKAEINLFVKFINIILRFRCFTCGVYTIAAVTAKNSDGCNCLNLIYIFKKQHYLLSEAIASFVCATYIS